MINDLINYIAAEKVEEFHFNNDFLQTTYNVWIKNSLPNWVYRQFEKFLLIVLEDEIDFFLIFSAFESVKIRIV